MNRYSFPPDAAPSFSWHNAFFGMVKFSERKDSNANENKLGKNVGNLLHNKKKVERYTGSLDGQLIHDREVPGYAAGLSISAVTSPKKSPQSHQDHQAAALHSHGRAEIRPESVQRWTWSSLALWFPSILYFKFPLKMICQGYFPF